MRKAAPARKNSCAERGVPHAGQQNQLKGFAIASQSAQRRFDKDGEYQKGG
jgi:hypothetical protein